MNFFHSMLFCRTSLIALADELPRRRQQDKYSRRKDNARIAQTAPNLARFRWHHSYRDSRDGAGKNPFRSHGQTLKSGGAIRPSKLSPIPGNDTPAAESFTEQLSRRDGAAGNGAAAQYRPS